MPVEHVSDRGVAWIRYETGVPKRFAVTRVERDEVPRAVAAEQQVAGRGQQAWAPMFVACFQAILPVLTSMARSSVFTVPPPRSVPE